LVGAGQHLQRAGEPVAGVRRRHDLVAPSTTRRRLADALGMLDAAVAGRERPVLRNIPL